MFLVLAVGFYFSFTLFIIGYKKGEEYDKLGPIEANILNMLRMATIGEHTYEMLAGIEEFEVYLYYSFWVITTLVFNIILLNFIIADVSASYERINENVQAIIL